MAALPTDRMRNFVGAMLETGGVNHTRCAKLAGYTGTDENLRVTGHRLAHDERIQAAIQEEGGRRLKSGVGIAVAFLHEAIDNTTYSVKDRLRAAEMLLNRSGLPAVTEQKVKVEHTMSEGDIVKRIEMLANKMGLDPQKLIGDRRGIVEGEFVEIPEEPDIIADMDWTAAE